MPKTLGIDDMREAIKRVLGGGVWTPPDVDLTGGADAESAALMARLASLTPQQVRVLMMLSEGMLNKQIAYELSVSEATVKAHVSKIFAKLDCTNRVQIAIIAHEAGLTDLDADQLTWTRAEVAAALRAASALSEREGHGGQGRA